ncbi:MAG: hypothetical protein AVDCRST_MAG59-1893, partial [uncultured Thermomicrobiales bacterium]
APAPRADPRRRCPPAWQPPNPRQRRPRRLLHRPRPRGGAGRAGQRPPWPGQGQGRRGAELRPDPGAPGVRLLPRRPRRVLRAGLRRRRFRRGRLRPPGRAPGARGGPRQGAHRRDSAARRHPGSGGLLRLRRRLRCGRQVPGHCPVAREHRGGGLRRGNRHPQGARPAAGGGDDRHGRGPPRRLPQPRQRRQPVPRRLRRADVGGADPGRGRWLRRPLWRL